MEWIEGVKLTNKEAMAAAGHEITDFVDVGIECTLRQLLEEGYFHAGEQLARAQACFARAFIVCLPVYTVPPPKVCSAVARLQGSSVGSSRC